MPRYRVRRRSFINGALIERGTIVPLDHVGENDLWPKGHLELLPEEPAPAKAAPESARASSESKGATDEGGER